jgi:hypothetical protein
MLYASLFDALFESRLLSTCFPKAKLYIRHLPPIAFCLLFELALRVVGMLRLFQLVLSYWVVGKLITCSTWYMRWIWIGDKLDTRYWRWIWFNYVTTTLVKAEASVSHFACFTMTHLGPLGPRVRMNCSKLSALTTRGRFHGVSLDLLLFLELVYQGPQHRIYIWIHIWFELPVMVLKVLSPPRKGVVVSPRTVGRFIFFWYVLLWSWRTSRMGSLLDFSILANFWVRFRSSADFVTGSLVGWPP